MQINALVLSLIILHLMQIECLELSTESTDHDPRGSKAADSRAGLVRLDMRCPGCDQQLPGSSPIIVPSNSGIERPIPWAKVR